MLQNKAYKLKKTKYKFLKDMKVGFVAHGPASANSLLPIIEKLEDKVDIRLFAYHPYVSGLWKCEQVIGNPKEFKELDVIVYGTGSGNEIELNVPVEARKWGIPSISILDCYWAEEDNLIERFKNKPTYIIVPNKESKEKLKRLSILPEEFLFAFGNPHFDRLEPLKGQITPTNYPLNIVFFLNVKVPVIFQTHILYAKKFYNH